MALMSIGEVARRAGMLPTTLRYYESIGLLPEPTRQNGHRRYNTDVFQRLEIIHTAQQAGFTLAEVRVLFDEILSRTSPAAKWQGLIQHKLQEIDGMMVKIQSMKNLLEDILHCEDEQLADCIYITGQKHKNYK
jgi:MerR family transcriptional regulator, redox-sensitive transcriptional activator SoxR